MELIFPIFYNRKLSIKWGNKSVHGNTARKRVSFAACMHQQIFECQKQQNIARKSDSTLGFSGNLRATRENTWMEFVASLSVF